MAFTGKTNPIKQLARASLLTLAVILSGTVDVNASPTLGAHALSFYPVGGSGGLSTPAITTQTSGSTLLAWVGRGKTNMFTSATFPVDNKGNSFIQLDTFHDYGPLWPESGEALYSSLSVAGGATHTFTAPMPGDVDEITLAVVEVKNGGVIQDVQWNVVYAASHTSLNVTTTGPATLVAIWAGDSGAPSVTAVPNNGFVTIDSELLSYCQVEVVVATKEVAAAGTYNVTWTDTPAQGTHLWLVAVQSLPPVLQAHVAATNVVISWPLLGTGYTLETTSQLSTNTVWAPVTNVPTLFDAQNTITNALSPGSRFYRLKKP